MFTTAKYPTTMKNTSFLTEPKISQRMMMKDTLITILIMGSTSHWEMRKKMMEILINKYKVLIDAYMQCESERKRERERNREK